jgi:hypothetical protein
MRGFGCFFFLPESGKTPRGGGVARPKIAFCPFALPLLFPLQISTRRVGIRFLCFLTAPKSPSLILSQISSAFLFLGFLSSVFVPAGKTRKKRPANCRFVCASFQPMRA